MSLEAFYQSVPAHCEVLKRSIADQNYGQFLNMKYRFKPEQPHPMWEGEDVPFCQDLNRMLEAHPGLHARNYTPGDLWDVFEYFISPSRRAEDYENPDLGRKAVNGERELAPHLVGAEGVALRFTPPETVKKILTYLMQTDFRAQFDFPRMCQATIYQNREDWTAESYWPLVDGLLRDFTGLYRQAAIHNEGVLVWID